MRDDHDNDRKLPPPLERLVPNDFRNGKVRQQSLPKPTLRAIRIKGDQLPNAIHRGGQLDWSDIHERYVDLWREARLCIWRTKHKKAGDKENDPVTGNSVLTFAHNEKLFLAALDVARGIFDSLVKVRKERGPSPDATGILR